MRLIVCLLAACLTGCNSIPPGMGYAHNDGTLLTSAADLAKFDTDRTICLGDMSKADMSGTVINTDNEIENAINHVSRKEEAGTVMLGCMAQHGYKVIVAQVH